MELPTGARLVSAALNVPFEIDCEISERTFEKAAPDPDLEINSATNKIEY